MHAYYGAIHALKGVSLVVGDGEIVTLLGANGAGKSTTLKTISGLLRPRKGTIQFDGDDLTRRSATQIVKAGVAQSPEGRRLFGRMTVIENLEMGAFQRIGQGGDRRGPRARLRSLPAPRRATLAEGRHALGRRAADVRDGPGAARAAAPAAAGRALDGSRARARGAHIRGHRRDQPQGTTVLLVEQNALMALEIAHRGYVLGTGKVALSDTAEALRGNEAVRKTYLGED